MDVLLNELTVELDGWERALVPAAARRLHLPPAAVTLLAVVRRAVDARPLRPRPCYVVNAAFRTDRDVALDRIAKAALYTPLPEEIPSPAELPLNAAPVWDAGERPVVIGCGPAGLAAAYYLARAGAKPLLLERGREIPARRPAVGRFWGRGILDPENNALYGEGGAGAFSDGKLTSRGKDAAGRAAVMEMLIAAGAPASVRYDAQAHLGSDVLARIVPGIRRQIIDAGGEVRFGARLDDLLIKDGRLQGLTAGGEEIVCRRCLLAAGHSADDVYQMLARRGVALSGKGYALGVRVEIPQAAADRAQWGRFAAHPALGAASFFLTCQGRCHTFCMCPGGRVIACAALPGTAATNGMSLSPRSGRFANAAFLIPRESGGTLAAWEEIREIERRAFTAGGGDFYLPATTLAAFPGAAEVLPERSCRRSRAADFRSFLPADVTAALGECLPVMLRKLGQIAPEKTVIYGAETRSTSPVRILRNEEGESVSLKGLFPAGEGAGYAGGIVSSAVDGLRAAQRLFRQLDR